MTNEEIIVAVFLYEHPKFLEKRKSIYANIYGDIYERCEDGERKQLAVSDLPHDINYIKELMPSSWTLK